MNSFEIATEANRGYKREKILYVNSAGYFKEFDPAIIRKIDRPFCPTAAPRCRLATKE